MKNSTALITVAAVGILSFAFSGVITAPIKDDALSPKEVDTWFRKMAHRRPDQLSKLRFYFQGRLGGKNSTSVVIAHGNETASSPTYFGAWMAADIPLTVTPAFLSKRVGYARGLYGTASQEEEALVFAVIFVFTDGDFNGSTLSVLGHNPYRHAYRELPVVGGTGFFRLAVGISTWKTYFFDAGAGRVTVEINVQVLHYGA
ncbi:dirigent protein 23-like [Andrographis paniculata]|uniref:dirigent protein 23-like n=1 Tax=Andrographis paniculata TaxID=175694 RepID=UPI0021E9326E|nr:dirigent protein 23-like [Andrographis paniculata]